MKWKHKERDLNKESFFDFLIISMLGKDHVASYKQADGFELILTANDIPLPIEKVFSRLENAFERPRAFLAHYVGREDFPDDGPAEGSTACRLVRRPQQRPGDLGEDRYLP